MPKLYLPILGGDSIGKSSRNYINARIREIDETAKDLKAEKEGCEWILKLIKKNLNICTNCDGNGYIKYLTTENDYKMETCTKCSGHKK